MIRLNIRGRDNNKERNKKPDKGKLSERIKRMFHGAASVNGSYSVGMIAIVAAIVVVVNMIAGQLPESMQKIDISDNKIYEISDTSKNLLKDLKEKITFTIYAEKSSTDERIKTFINKYKALSNKIEVQWVDPVQHPSELQENNVEQNNILVSCEDTGKSTIVTFDDILVSDDYSYYMGGSGEPTSFDGEGQLTSAVNYVTSDTTKKIYYTTGHGEATFSTTISELFEKNNMTESELNLIMDNKIPDDCDLLFLNAPTSDITDDEKSLILSYMQEGGKVFVILGESESETPNLDEVLSEYGIKAADGYIADMQRCYQGNYYYIFPEITAADELAEGLSSDMVLLVNSRGLTLTDPARETITNLDFMTTSSDAYAVTEDAQEQGTYTLGAVATETITPESEEDEESDGTDETADDESDTSDEAADDESDGTDETADGESDDTDETDEETIESRLTVVASESLIDSQITETFATLENTDLFMNAVSANFDDVENVAIEPKSLEVTYNTMQHAGLISLCVIFVLPAVILIYGFVRWWKRRKA